MSEQGRDGSPSRPHNPHPNKGGFGETALPKRKHLSHDVPPWVSEEATFFITITCTPRGENHLAHPGVADALWETVTTRIEKGQWWPHLIVLMPDHLHALVAFAPGHTMQQVIRDWKRYTARHSGIRWQRDFFDHRIRSESSRAEKWRYILENPVRAGLTDHPEAWPYVWVGRDGSPNRPYHPHPNPGGFGEAALPNL